MIGAVCYNGNKRTDQSRNAAVLELETKQLKLAGKIFKSVVANRLISVDHSHIVCVYCFEENGK